MSDIVRYLNLKQFNNFKEDFSFLIDKVRKSNGELDLQLRKGYFNLYYKGNSLAKIYVSSKPYKVEIHTEFKAPEISQKDSKNRFNTDRFTLVNKDKYHKILLQSEELRIFFQKKIIDGIKSNIKKVNYKEEITFEQGIITDNMDRSDLIFIDRQVGGGGIPGAIDLLALKHKTDNKFSFLIIEVKLGNNPELKGEVIEQIERYESAISENIETFKTCYKKNYAQKKELGLLTNEGLPENIEISNQVDGRIVVGGYSGIGRTQIDKLKIKYPKWENKIIEIWLELKDKL